MYSTSNPPALMIQRIGAGPAFWTYSSTDDDATVNGSGYITNATDLGLRVGDMVYVWDATTPKGSQHYVASISAAGAATLAFAAVA